MTAGNVWVIQTDKEKCWQVKWSLQECTHIQGGIWKVEYLERDNLPVLNDLPDVEAVYSGLKTSLLEAMAFSKKWKFGWKNWFAEGVTVL